MLQEAPSFQEIAQSMTTVMSVQCSHVNPCDEADGFKRVVACVRIDKPLFDLFLNSPNGYGGSYYHSPAHGLRMNSLLMQLVAPLLMEFRSHNDMPEWWVSKSLLAASSKAWLAEVGKGFCEVCEGDWSGPKDNAPEILNGRWEIATEANSIFGVKAPFLEKLRVMGAFVSREGDEYVTKGKVNRAQEIHRVGWS